MVTMDVGYFRYWVAMGMEEENIMMVVEEDQVVYLSSVFPCCVAPVPCHGRTILLPSPPTIFFFRSADMVDNPLQSNQMTL